MAIATQPTELRRMADLTVIQRAVEAKLPDAVYPKATLKDIAEICRRDYAARPARDCNHVRDQMLLIGIEWDLTDDQLDRQSDACLRAVADFLR